MYIREVLLFRVINIQYYNEAFIKIIRYFADIDILIVSEQSTLYLGDVRIPKINNIASGTKKRKKSNSPLYIMNRLV